MLNSDLRVHIDNHSLPIWTWPKKLADVQTVKQLSVQCRFLWAIPAYRPGQSGDVPVLRTEMGLERCLPQGMLRFFVDPLGAEPSGQVKLTSFPEDANGHALF